MEEGKVKIATDEDFQKLWELAFNDQTWKLEYQSGPTLVWSKGQSNQSNLKMVKVRTTYDDVDPFTLFDILMDGEYRSTWDNFLCESFDIGYLNANNDVGYYAMSCPPPIQNRDYVLQRSWLITPQRLSIFNHSIRHRNHPPRKYMVRAVSYLTGYVVEPIPGIPNSCNFTYVTLSDPKGYIPAWAINKGTQLFAPRMIKTLEKAAHGYKQWKEEHRPGYKPWLYPEQITLPRLTEEECTANAAEETYWDSA